jgi:hypothetical protein
MRRSAAPIEQRRRDSAGRAGIVDGKLVLVDAGGVELQTLARP